MSGLPWVKVSTDLLDHPKTAALAHLLGQPLAAFYPVSVLCHLARFYPVGSIPDSPESIGALEAAARWAGEPGALVEALVEAGFMDRRRGRIASHGWEEWQIAHIEKAARDRARMKAKRAKPSESQEKARATVARPSRDGRALEERERRGEEKMPEATTFPPQAAGVEGVGFEGSGIEGKGPARPTGTPRSTGASRSTGNPRHQPTIALWARLWDELRGGGAYVVTSADAAQVKRLLKYPDATDAEIEARARRFFADPWMRDRASLAFFVGRWSQLSTPTAAPGIGAPGRQVRDYTNPAGYDEVVSFRGTP